MSRLPTFSYAGKTAKLYALAAADAAAASLPPDNRDKYAWKWTLPASSNMTVSLEFAIGSDQVAGSNVLENLAKVGPQPNGLKRWSAYEYVVSAKGTGANSNVDGFLAGAFYVFDSNVPIKDLNGNPYYIVDNRGVIISRSLATQTFTLSIQNLQAECDFEMQIARVSY